MRKYLFNVISIIIILLLWTSLFHIYNNPVIPNVKDIGYAFIHALFDDDFSKHLIATLKITFIGISVAIVIGLALSIICEISNIVFKILKPIIDFFRSVPAIALFPLIIALFGIKDISRIIIVFWTAMPPIFISTMNGLQNVSKEILEAISLETNNKPIIAFKIKFPLIISDILNGIKIGIGTGFISVVTAEMLGASKGIGFMVLWCTNTFKYNYVYAYILIIALLSSLFNLILNLIIKILDRRKI